MTLRVFLLVVVATIGCGRALELSEGAADSGSSCSQHVDQFDCDKDPSCYSLFTFGRAPCPRSDATCGPASFSGCEPGPARCAPTTACELDAPECEPPFSNAYASGSTCVMGCVLTRACSSN